MTNVCLRQNLSSFLFNILSQFIGIAHRILIVLLFHKIDANIMQKLQSKQPNDANLTFEYKNNNQMYHGLASK